VVGGLLTGIFGSSDVVKSLGNDANSTVALATVGAAVAVAFIAAGAVFLLATKSKRGDYFTVGGLLGASAIVLAGASGELWVLYRSGEKLDLGGWQHTIPKVLFCGALALLALYAFRTIPATLKHGLNQPRPAPQSDTIVAANMIIAALKNAHPDINEEAITTAVHKVERADARSPDEPLPPRRSALL